MCGYDFPDEASQFGYNIAAMDGPWSRGSTPSTAGRQSISHTRIGACTLGIPSGHRWNQERSCVMHSCSENVRKQLLSLAQACGRPDAKVWSRHDLASSCYRTTGEGGPHLAQVVGRLSVLSREQAVIEKAPVETISRNLEHAKLPSGRADLTTYLLYVDDRWDDKGSRKAV